MEPGSILADRYRVGETLGKGGMGLVVKAVHLQLGTPVAIKVLRREAAEEPELVARFLREARSAARLRGEHICRVTDFGQTDDGTPFMVMEYLEGEDLKTVVDASGPLEARQVATYMLQACIGVAEAHALGIIHRDLKPGNLFVVKQPDGRRSVKLLDFGIAKSLRSQTVDASLTNTSKAMGSPAYMSPEQLRTAGTVDARSDVWSLGVTMYELLTEQRPFDGDTPYELAIRINNDPPRPLPDTVPAELARVVLRCLEKDPNKRYADVAELAAALAPLVRNGRDLAQQAKAALSPETAASSDVAMRAATVAPSPMTETTLGNASGAVAAIPQRSKLRFMLPLAMIVITISATVGAIRFMSDPEDVPAPAASDPPPTPPPTSAPAPTAVPPVDPAVDPAPPPDAAEAQAPPVDAAEIIAEPPVTTDPVEKPKRKKKKPAKPRDYGSSRY